MMSTCDKETFLVAGGAGFIGVNFVKYLLAHRSARVLVLDALTYAGNASSLAEEMENGSIEFFKADIADYDTVESIMFYRLLWETVVIYHIAHGASDYPKLLKTSFFS